MKYNLFTCSARSVFSNICLPAECVGWMVIKASVERPTMVKTIQTKAT